MFQFSACFIFLRGGDRRGGGAVKIKASVVGSSEWSLDKVKFFGFSVVENFYCNEDLHR